MIEKEPRVSDGYGRSSKDQNNSPESLLSGSVPDEKSQGKCLT